MAAIGSTTLVFFIGMIKFIRGFFLGSKTIAWLSFVNLLNSIVSIFCGLLVARWVLPEELGSFNSLSIISSYIILIQLGVPNGLGRELPYFSGKGDLGLVHRYASTAKFFLWYLSWAVLLVSFFFAFYFCWTMNWQHAAGSVVVGFTSFQILYVTKYLKMLYRSDNHFILLAKIDLIIMLVSIFSLFLVFEYRFYGLCIRAVLTFIVDWYFAEKWKPLHCAASFDTGIFRSLLKVGIPIFGVASIYALWPVIQRTVVLGTLGPKGLGLFSLASIVQGMLIALNTPISNILFPKMCRLYGEGKGIRELLRVPIRPFLFSLAIYSAILLSGWTLFPALVSYVLPNYQAGVEAAQWMFPVALVSSFGVFANVYMVVQKNHHRVIGYCIGMGVWFLYLQMFPPLKMHDLHQFSKAMFWGFMATYLIDGIFYYRYWQSEKQIV